jgi:outer membrane scaffolding protein for murein synthesis (MipA/OmpV family)
MLTPGMTVVAFGLGSRLGQKAADSPLARQRNGFAGGLGIALGI